MEEMFEDERHYYLVLELVSGGEASIVQTAR